jgi:hypothetical protein
MNTAELLSCVIDKITFTRVQAKCFALNAVIQSELQTPDIRGSNHLWNVGLYLQDYI